MQPGYGGAQHVTRLAGILVLGGIVAGIAQAVQPGSLEQMVAVLFLERTRSRAAFTPARCRYRPVSSTPLKSCSCRSRRRNTVWSTSSASEVFPGNPVSRPENAVVMSFEDALDAFRLVSHGHSLYL